MDKRLILSSLKTIKYLPTILLAGFLALQPLSTLALEKNLAPKDSTTNIESQIKTPRELTFKLVDAINNGSFDLESKTFGLSDAEFHRLSFFNRGSLVRILPKLKYFRDIPGIFDNYSDNNGVVDLQRIQNDYDIYKFETNLTIPEQNAQNLVWLASLLESWNIELIVLNSNEGTNTFKLNFN